MSYIYRFKIAEVHISFSCGYQVEIPDNLLLFRYEGKKQKEKDEILCYLYLRKDLEQNFHGNKPEKDDWIEEQQEFLGSIPFGGKGDSIDYYMNPDTGVYSVVYLDDLLQDNILFKGHQITGYLGLEYMLLEKQAFWIHSSLIVWHGIAVMFCGPSGIGKSTQADLWHEYEKAEILNGDRALIRYDEKEGYRAFGSPFAGSSHIYVSKGYPLKYIFVLSKSRKNCIKEMKPLDIFLNLYLEALHILENDRYEYKLTEEIQKLAESISVRRFCCDISVNAVMTVKQFMEGDNGTDRV